MKQTWSKLRAQVELEYFGYVCFIFTSCLLHRANGVLLKVTLYLT